MKVFTRKRDFKSASRAGGELGPVLRGGLSTPAGTLVHHVGGDWAWHPGQGVGVLTYRDHICLLVSSAFTSTWLAIPKQDVLHWSPVERSSIPMRRSKDHTGAVIGAVAYGPVGALVGAAVDQEASNKPTIGITYRVGDEEHAVYLEFGSPRLYRKMHDALLADLPDQRRGERASAA